jgi:tRNA pseudouridine(55) synthase
MGKITKVDYRLPEIHEIKKEIKKLAGRTVLPIPPYSSVPINGRPSFMYARAGELGLDNINSREMNITKITLGTCKKISADKVLKSAQEKISKVSGDFRQKKILKLWNKKLKAIVAKFLVVDVVISCASGTYIRSIAHQLGNRLQSPTLLYNLKRTRVGTFSSNKSTRI